MTPTDENTVLIIEDDANTSALVALYLEREGFKPVTAADGEAGLSAAEKHSPVLVILDLMLPRMDGWDVCRRLRQRTEVPVIMLTARGEEIDRVSGLTLGADDYVVKPFSPRELVARVKAVLRRAGTPVAGGRRLVYENILLDLDRHQLSVDGLPVPLTPHEFTLIETLMAAPGRAFSRDALLSALYPQGEAMVIERVVDVHIGKLRQKIEPDPSAPRRILTVRGIGYRFADPAHGPTGASR
ncbi:MAG: response regulator transcription factor [Pseudomonadota bacterium]